MTEGLRIKSISEVMWRSTCPLHYLFIDRDIGFIERIRRYVCPAAFTDYVRHLVVKEYSHVASEYYGAREVTSTVHTIEYMKNGIKVKYFTVPVIAYYDQSMADKVLRIEIGNGMQVVEITSKCPGVEWVPLVHEDEVYIFPPESTIIVKPAPKKIVVVTLEPKGVSKTGRT